MPALYSSGRRTGRPTLFTPERCQAYLDALAVGTPRTIAAKAAGWTHVHKDYMAKGYILAQEALVRDLTDYEQEFADFFTAVNRVEAMRIQRNLQVIISSAEVDGEWKAAAWLCERTHPDEFARRTAVEVTGKAGAPLTLDIKMDDLLDALSKLKPQDSRFDDPVSPPPNGKVVRALPPASED